MKSVPQGLSSPMVLPALKRMSKVATLRGALKRSFPRMNAGAPTG
jgi:hypothetical protein